MRKLVRHRPSPGMVVAVIAVILALGGTAFAALSKKEKKTVRKIADTEITKKAPGLSVANSANSAALGGVPASGYVQGSGRQVTVRGYVNTGGATATLISAAGVGNLTMDCANTGQDVTLTYTNTSGAIQLGDGSVANQGASTVSVNGVTLPNNTTLTRTGSTAGASDGHIFTFEAVPIDPTGAPGLSFHGTGWTKAHGENRCVVFGVATVG